MSAEKLGLVRVIAADLLSSAKAVALLLLILLSALAVVVSTHNTRLLIMRREVLHAEQQVLDSEWRNLLLEERALSDADRIERLAIKKLKMQYLAPGQERVVKHPE